MAPPPGLMVKRTTLTEEERADIEHKLLLFLASRQQFCDNLKRDCHKFAKIIKVDADKLMIVLDSLVSELIDRQ